MVLAASPKADGFAGDTSIRGVFTVSRQVRGLAWNIFALAQFIALLAPGPLLRVVADVSFLARFRAPSLAPKYADAWDPGRAKTRHWIWIHPQWGDTFSPTEVAQRAGDRLGFLGVAKPIRRDE